MCEHKLLMNENTNARAARIVAALQPRKWRKNEEMRRKWRENEEMRRKWRENEEMERD